MLPCKDCGSHRQSEEPMLKLQVGDVSRLIDGAHTHSLHKIKLSPDLLDKIDILLCEIVSFGSQACSLSGRNQTSSTASHHGNRSDHAAEIPPFTLMACPVIFAPPG